MWGRSIWAKIFEPSPEFPAKCHTLMRFDGSNRKSVKSGDGYINQFQFQIE
jgi:hypothetical protein